LLASFAHTMTGMMMARRITAQRMPSKIFIFAFCRHMCRFTSRDDLWNLRSTRVQDLDDGRRAKQDDTAVWGTYDRVEGDGEGQAVRRVQ